MSKFPLAADAALIEEALGRCLHELDARQAELYRAMRYSLLDGGKRLRPALLLEFCRLSGGTAEQALPFACAIEMVHTYSLIHDDLPCMDDAATRRGRASNHKVFGEAMALLAGDGLLTEAFRVMLSPEAVQAAGTARAAEAALLLAEACGPAGMVAGQAVDIRAEGRPLPLSELEQMDAWKTGALIQAAAAMGCAVGGAPPELREAAKEYAAALGLAFQIEDDLLDAIGTEEAVGKPLHSDAEQEKCTYVTLLGQDKAREEVLRLTERAVRALEPYGDAARPLMELARYLAGRNT